MPRDGADRWLHTRSTFHQVRRLPVTDGDGCCAGIISQADIVSIGLPRMTAELLSQISRETGRASA
jgi:CBS-domain-containing membrane protein